MRILIVSYFFPPYNSIGAVRVGKTARILGELGHDVRVVTAREQRWPATLTTEIDESRVRYTPWIDVSAPIDLYRKRRGATRPENRAFQGQGGGSNPLRKLLATYQNILMWPDPQVGWAPFGIVQTLGWLGGWRPDLIFASARPSTSLIIASVLSKLLETPWVAELRDPLTEPLYYQFAEWRRRLDESLFAAILSTASGLVTVSEPLADTLRRQHNKPTAVVLNGYDPRDYPVAPPRRDNAGLRIVYTGHLYGGLRDPSPLFEAIAKLGDAGKDVRVAFYGKGFESATTAAVKFGVEGQFETHAPVPRKDALFEQRRADILLLLLGMSEADKGTLTGKLFEYVGARRPILAIGRLDNAACELVSTRALGHASSDPADIARMLHRWLEIKRQTGGLDDLDAGCGRGLTRADQVATLETFLGEMAGSNRGLHRA